MTALPEHREIHATWHRAADVTRARSLALFMDLKHAAHDDSVIDVRTLRGERLRMAREKLTSRHG
jgi:hypothetical protein